MNIPILKAKVPLRPDGLVLAGSCQVDYIRRRIAVIRLGRDDNGVRGCDRAAASEATAVDRIKLYQTNYAE